MEICKGMFEYKGSGTTITIDERMHTVSAKNFSSTLWTVNINNVAILYYGIWGGMKYLIISAQNGMRAQTISGSIKNTERIEVIDALYAKLSSLGCPNLHLKYVAALAYKSKKIESGSTACKPVPTQESVDRPKKPNKPVPAYPELKRDRDRKKSLPKDEPIWTGIGSNMEYQFGMSKIYLDEPAGRIYAKNALGLVSWKCPISDVKIFHYHNGKFSKTLIIGPSAKKQTTITPYSSQKDILMNTLYEKLLSHGCKNLNMGYKEALNAANMPPETECTCRSCGNVWYYTDEDVKNNKNKKDLSNALMLDAAGSALLGGGFKGTMAASSAINNQVVDLDRCPKCGSRAVSKRKVQN